MRTLALPLGLYVAMTVVVPVVDGSARGAAFLEHAAVVIAGAALVGLVVGRLTRAR
jgi:hypothetical protein